MPLVHTNTPGKKRNPAIGSSGQAAGGWSVTPARSRWSSAEERRGRGVGSPELGLRPKFGRRSGQRCLVKRRRRRVRLGSNSGATATKVEQQAMPRAPVGSRWGSRMIRWCRKWVEGGAWLWRRQWRRRRRARGERGMVEHVRARGATWDDFIASLPSRRSKRGMARGPDRRVGARAAQPAYDAVGLDAGAQERARGRARELPGSLGVLWHPKIPSLKYT
jgi:hypothetical protein